MFEILFSCAGCKTTSHVQFTPEEIAARNAEQGLWFGCFRHLNKRYVEQHPGETRELDIFKPFTKQHIDILLNDIQRYLQLPYTKKNFGPLYYKTDVARKHTGRMLSYGIIFQLAQFNQLDALCEIFAIAEMAKICRNSICSDLINCDSQQLADVRYLPYSRYIGNMLMQPRSSNAIQDPSNKAGLILLHLINTVQFFRYSLEIRTDRSEVERHKLISDYETLIESQRVKINEAYADVLEKFDVLLPILEGGCLQQPLTKSSRILA
jgi:hypothetical protein